MVCRNCGKEIEDTSKFCKFCGSPVVQESDLSIAVNTLPQDADSQNIILQDEDVQSTPDLEECALSKENNILQKGPFGDSKKKRNIIIGTIGIIAIILVGIIAYAGLINNLDPDKHTFSNPITDSDIAFLRKLEVKDSEFNYPTFDIKNNWITSLNPEFNYAFTQAYEGQKVAFLNLPIDEYVGNGIYLDNTHFIFAFSDVFPETFIGFTGQEVTVCGTIRSDAYGTIMILIDQFFIGSDLWSDMEPLREQYGSYFDNWTSGTNNMSTSDTSTANPVSNIKLPEPDSETSDMPTFYPGVDGFPEIGYGTIADDKWLAAFRDEYGNTEIRIVYFYGEGPVQINGRYFMHCADWYFEIPDDDVEIIADLQNTFGPDGCECIVEGTVSMQPISMYDECRMLLTDCHYDYVMGTQYWKDQEYSDNPNGDGYDDGNNPSSIYDGDPFVFDVDMAKAFNQNRYRFMDSYFDNDYFAATAEVRYIGTDHVTLDIEYDDGVSYVYQDAYITAYYDDIYESGAINLNEGGTATVLGYLNKKESTDLGALTLWGCVFIP